MLDCNVLPSKTIVDDRYEIIDLLGVGGMGAIYKARELDLGRNVALKFLHQSGLSDREDFARFEREAKILAELSHQNIATLYRFSQWNGMPYIAMEYLDGRSLSIELDFCDQLSPERTIKIGQQICAALSHAHSHGVIHRDIKPQNIMLLNHPEPDFVKVVDFGLARTSEASQKLTQTGFLIGSVMYMSPEQCQGVRADDRSDIYSLGCVLYQCLTGRTPFVNDNPIAMLHLHINETPEVPSSLSKAKLPVGLNRVILKCLQKNTKDRYATAQDLNDDLRSVAEGRGDTISAIDIVLPTPKKKLSKKALAGFSLATALTLIAAVGFIWINDNTLAVVGSLAGKSEQSKLNFAKWLMDQQRWKAADILLGKINQAKVSALPWMRPEAPIDPLDAIDASGLAAQHVLFLRGECAEKTGNPNAAVDSYICVLSVCSRGLLADLRAADLHMSAKLNKANTAIARSLLFQSAPRLTRLLSPGKLKLPAATEAVLNRAALYASSYAPGEPETRDLLYVLAYRKPTKYQDNAEMLNRLAETSKPLDEMERFARAAKACALPESWDLGHANEILDQVMYTKRDWHGILKKYNANDPDSFDSLTPRTYILEALLQLQDYSTALKLGEYFFNLGPRTELIVDKYLLSVYKLAPTPGAANKYETMRKRIDLISRSTDLVNDFEAELALRYAIQDYEAVGEWKDALRLVAAYEARAHKSPNFTVPWDMIKVRAYIGTGQFDNARKCLSNMTSPEIKAEKSEMEALLAIEEKRFAEAPRLVTRCHEIMRHNDCVQGQLIKESADGMKHFLLMRLFLKQGEKQRAVEQAKLAANGLFVGSEWLQSRELARH